MVKNLFFLLFFGISPLLGSTLPAHPLYTSVTEIEYNEKEQSVEVTCRLFTDDFESILRKNYNTKVDLFNDGFKNAATYIPAYIKKNLALTVNGKAVTLQYIGYERKNEACWCYFEATGIPTPNKMEVTTTLLYDFTDKQINMIHATVNGNRKSTKLNHPESKALFDWND
jgi:hypothetical protein